MNSTNERVYAALLDPQQGERDWELVPVPIASAAKAAARTSFRLHLHFYLFTWGFIIKMLFLNDVTSWFLGYSNLVGFQNVYYHGIKLAGAVWRWQDIKQVFVKSPLLQNSLFRVVERVRTTVKGTTVKSALAKHTNSLFSHLNVQICDVLFAFGARIPTSGEMLITKVIKCFP